VSRLDVVVFSGPTLAPASVAEALPGALCLGPIQRGEVLRVLRHAPQIICIVDGLFGGALPVWHKEILWALERGVRVFGAASMGALRAAELAAFGMVGVGRIFEAYAREELEDEDEVTVVHAGPERDYRPTSEALVDMRATLEAALERGVIGPEDRTRLVELARATFYAERSYVSLLAGAEQAGVGAPARRALAEFLQDKGNRRSLKREDALECLGVIRRQLAAAGSETAPTPSPPSFQFSYTDAFDALLSEERASEERLSEASGAAAGGDLAHARELPSELLVEELQLLGPEVFEPLLRQATARALRVVLGTADGGAPEGTLDLDMLQRSSAQRSSGHGLDNLQRMLAELDLSPADYRAWMREEARIREVEERTHGVLQAQFAPLLRALGDYPRVAQRARHKLHVCGVAAAPVATGEADDVWRTYFEGTLNLDVPEDLDAYAASVGFRDRSQLYTAVTRELEFRRLG
jgi:hypothetical protein